MVVVNFFSGPGAGKSTCCSTVFSELKKQSINVELVTEYAKDLVWSGNFKELNCQALVTANQYWKVLRLQGQVDVVVTDSPIPLGVLYGREYNCPECTHHWESHVFELFNQFTNLNYFVERQPGYNPKGRVQNLEEAMALDQKVIALLKEYDITPTTVNKFDTDSVVTEIINCLKLV